MLAINDKSHQEENLYPSSINQRENRCNRKPCQVEYGGKSQNIKEFKSTIPHGSGFGKINSSSQSYNDDQTFDKNDLSNIDI